MHRFKRVLSILLASLTVFSSTHVVALAEGIDQLRTDLIAAETGGSVVLSENMEEVEPGDTEADTSSTPETDTGTDASSAPETDTGTDTGSAPETDTEPGTGSAPETDTGTDAGSALETDTETGTGSAPDTGDGSASTPGTGDDTISTLETPDLPAALAAGELVDDATGVTLTYGENTLFPEVEGVGPVLSVSRDGEYDYYEILTQHFPTISKAEIYTVDINGGRLEGNDHSLSLPAGEGSAVFRIDGNTVSLLDAASDDTDLTVNGAGTGTYAVARFMTPEEIAEYYYGEGGAADLANVTIESQNESADTVQAGETLDYIVTIDLAPVETYFSANGSQPLAKKFDKVTLELRLPEGITIVEPPSGNYGVFSAFTYNKETKVWTATALQEIEADASHTFDFTLQLQVEGNGAVEVGHLYKFIGDKEHPHPVTLSATFTALDYSSNWDEPEKLDTYTQIGTADLRDLTATSPDTWALSKTSEGAPTVNEGADTVTFQWTVSAGLAGTDEAGHMTIISDPGTYARNGRAPFVGSSFDITEVLAVLDTDGQPTNVTPQSVTITPNFGNGEEIVLIGDGAVADPTIPYDTCGAHDDLTGVDGAAPYYSTYTVTAVYNKDDFTVRWQESTGEKMTVQNTATLSYRIAGKAPHTSADMVKVPYVYETKPAALQVEKLIEAYNSNSTTSFAEYNDYAPLPQTVTFTVTNESGNAELYKFDPAENENRGGYIRQESNTITLTAGQPFPIYYLEPGTYTIQEKKMENTTPVGETEREVTLGIGETPTTVTFTNKEALGGLTFKKVDSLDNSKLLPGAEFALYDNEGCTGDPVATATTGSDGTATIGRLVPETYYLKETKAPEGYVIANDEPIEVVIEANEVTKLETAIQNHPNSASVTLTKYLKWNDEKTQITSSNYADEFKGAFTLQKKVGEDWVDVHTNLSINVNNNVVNASGLPVYDENNDPITYRFVEKLPEGWHADGEQNGYAYSKEFDLVNQLGKKDPFKVEMTNTRNGSIAILKRTITAAEPSGIPAEGVSFQLYTDTDGNGVYELYTQPGEDGKYLTDAAGKLTITDLPTDQTYYVAETNLQSDYLMEAAGAKQISILLPDESAQSVWAVPVTFDSAEKLAVMLDINNVKQERKVTLYKTDAYTEKPIGGAVVTIQDQNGKFYNVDGTTSETEVSHSVPKTGLTLTLPVGQAYTVTEVKTPANYVQENKTVTIDLTDAAVGSDKIGDIYKTYTITNTPYPKLFVTKTVNNGTAPTGVTYEFEVYTKEGNEFKPYQLNGTTLTLKSGTAIQLPAGTYYLHEIVPTDANGIPSVLDPDKFSEKYKDQGVTGTVAGETERKFFFGPVEVKQQKEVNEKTINNLANTGTLTLTKEDSQDDSKKLEGATFKLEATVDGKTLSFPNLTTNEKGVATFTELPVYDANGHEITYTLTETAAPEGYYLDTTDKTSQSGLTLAEGTATDAGTFTNTPLRTFTINKTYSHNWEYPFTGKEYPMPGVRLALYVKEDGSYALVTDEKGDPVEATTGSLGDATFTGLENREYVVVEVSIPQEGHPLFTEDYRYMTPAGDGKEYLADTGLMQDDGSLPKKLSADDLNGLNYVTLAENKFTNDKKEYTTSFGDTLKNEVHWAQLRIEKVKWVDENEDEIKDEEENKTVPVDYAQFDLYMQVVSEKEGTVLTFDADNCTLIGQYTSGTLVNAAGERQTGKFATDILDADETVVYWLVETKAGPGSAIMPKNAITLFVMDNGDDDETTTRFTNDSKYEYEVEIEGGETETKTANCTTTCEYKVDDITEQSIENDPLYDGGPPRYALVKIAKWATEYVQNEDGEDVLSDNYTPLPNARYELWIVDKNGQKQGTEPFDILTVGMENIPPENGGQADSHTAWAVSDVLDFKQLQEEYGKKEGNIIWNDENDIGHLRMALQEVASPEGFVVDERTYYFIVDFKPDPEGEPKDYTTENETFFVTDADPADPDKENAYRLLDEYLENPPANILWFNSSESGQDLTGSYRLLNLRVDSYNLSIRKYGYTVNDDTAGKTVAELDAYFAEHPEQRTPLEGVKFTLQYYDFGGTAETGGWKDYDGYTDIVTDSNGTYRFMEGLPAGRYRLIETESAPGYGNTYNGPDNEGTATAGVRAIRFTIPLAGGSLNLYDPELVELRFQKTDMDGNGIGGATFELMPTKDGKVVEEGIQPAASDADGWVTFTVPDIEGAKWTLTETSAPDGFSNAYFEEFFRQAYEGNAAALALVDGGAELGNVYGFAETPNTEDVRFNEPIVTGQNKPDLSKPVENLRNPTTGEFMIQKVGEDGQPIENNPATFEVQRAKFTALSGEISLADIPSTSFTLKDTYTTGEDGIVKVPDLDPGIYAIKEITAPTGFELDPTVRYVVITGGMDITVTGTEGELVYTDPDVPIRIENKELVFVTVEKKVNDGFLTDTSGQTFTLTLTGPDGHKGTETGYTQTVTIKNGESGTFDGLKQDATYTLTEENIPTGYELESVTAKTADGTDVTDNGDGTYSFAAPNKNTNVTITVTNRLLKAEATILKVNEEDKPLSGATFDLYGPFESSKTAEEIAEAIKTAKPEQSITTDKDGTATFQVDLDNREGNQFALVETTAPDDYVKDVTPHIFTLTPGESQSPEDEEKALTITNRRGIVLQLNKFGGLHGYDLVSLSGVTFTLWQKDGENWQSIGTLRTENGTATSVPLDPGGIYAVSESSTPAGYAGLEGIWPKGSDTPCVPVTIQTASGQIEAYQLRDGGGTAGVTYSFDAYNIPTVTLTVHKEDVTELPNAAPEATVALYEVSPLTGDQIAAINNGDFSDIAELTDGLTPVTQETTSGSTDFTVQRGKTYLAVETGVSGVRENNTELPYNTLIKDDTRVLWAQAIAIPEDGGTGGQYELTLKNLYGEVTVEVTKQANTDTIGDLYAYADGQQVTYTITPIVSNPALPLTGFTLEDSGLTAQYGKGENQVPVPLPDGWYSIDSLTLQKPSHETGTIKGIDDKTYPIEATITCLDFNEETKVYEQVGASITVSLDNVAPGGMSVDLADGTEAFTITWSSSTLAEDTQAALSREYALGTAFDPGTVEAHVTINQLPDNDSAEKNPLVDQITNVAAATAWHYEWSSDGTPSLNPVMKQVTSTEWVDVSEPEAPTIFLSKTAETDDGSVNTGDSLAYNITIQNTSQNGLPMTDPVLIDLLPLGTSLPDSGPNDAPVVSLVDGPEGLQLGQNSVGYFSGNTYLHIPLSGSLPAGESVTVRVYIHVDANAASYGSQIVNHAFVTSLKEGVRTEENPTGATFKNENDWPDTLGAGDDGADDGRLDGLRDALGGGLKDNGFIHDSATVNCHSSGGVTPRKEAFGDGNSDGGYRTDTTAIVEANGTVFYRLSLINQRSSGEALENAVLLDRLPRENDGRGNSAGSEWSAYFAEAMKDAGDGSYEAGDLLLNVNRNGGLPGAFTVAIGTEELKRGSDYELYFYTGNLTEDHAWDIAVKAAEAAENDQKPDGWLTLEEINKKEDGQLDGRRTDVTAFLVRLTKPVEINTVLSVEYQLRAPADAAETAAMKTAVNDCIATYKDAGKVLKSQPVNAMIASERVGVGGNIWIDANDNGEQDDDIYQDYDISKRIRDALAVSLYTSESASSERYDDNPNAIRTPYEKPENDVWDGSFLFEGLLPGRLPDAQSDAGYHDLAEEEEGTVDKDHTFQYELNPGSLRAHTPTYVLEISSNGDAKFREAINTWEGKGRSDDPRELTEDNPLSSDSNFTQVRREDGTLTDNYYSERFYLWPDTVNTDTSKDFGVVPLRDLTVHKVAEGTDQPLEGAEFALYGPFDQDQTIREADLTNDKLVDTNPDPNPRTTDKNGDLTFEGLLYFKDYVLVETKSAPGYELEGASAVSDDVQVEKLTLEGKTAWLLPVPDEQNTEFDQTVTVSNKRHYEPVTWSPEVTKQLEGSLAPNPPRTFTFTLTPDPANPADGYAMRGGAASLTASVEVDAIDTEEPVSFKENGVDAVTFTKAGTYTFTVTETEGNDSDIVYDKTAWTVTVTVTPDENEGKLKASAEYAVVGSTDPANTTGAAFVNTMQEASLLLGKTVSGSRGDRQRDFTFQIRLTGPDVQPLNGDYPTIGGATEPGIVPPADGTLTVKDGVATVTLRHGQTVTIQGLPAGTVYTVTETDGSGYRTTYTNKDGTLVAGTTAEAWVENYRGGGGGGGDRDPDPDPHPHRDPDPGDRPHRDPLPDTGLNWTAPALLAGTGIALITAGLLPRRKKKEGDDDAR